MSQAITKQMRELRIKVELGGRDAGLDVVGRGDWGEFRQMLGGSQRDPLEHWDTPDTTGTEIGMSGEVTVAVGADGQLVNQARHRRPGDAPSTHLLKIDVRPTVVFGVDRNVPIIRWVANVSVFELTKAVMVIGAESGDVEAERALAGDRPRHVYGNDEKYREALPGLLHKTPREAVAAALRKISSGGRINLPVSSDTATGAPTVITHELVTAPSELGRGRPSWLLPLLGIVGIAVVIIALLTLTGGGDSEAEPAATPVPSITPAPVQPVAPSVAPPTPTPSLAIAVPELSIASTTTSTSTTTTEPTVIDSTIFDILDSKCFIPATGEPGDSCLLPIDVARFGSDPSKITVGLADGAVFGPGVVATLSLFLSGGPANDLLVECTTLSVCQTWAGPSFFNIKTEWFPIEFASIPGESGFLVQLLEEVDGTAGLAVPAVEMSDGTMIPAGEYKVVEAAIYVDQDGSRSNTLFAGVGTVWFK